MSDLLPSTDAPVPPMVVDNDTPSLAHAIPTSNLSPKERMDEFEQIMLGVKQTFTLGGTISLGELNPADLALMYYSANMQDSHILQFPATQGDLAEFYEKASPSPFGMNEEKVFDDTYRQAREFKPPNFALSHDLVLQPKILAILTANLQGAAGQIEASINKVNVYANGGFFKEHRDTPLGRDHIGTLTFCLPTAFTGGELVVSQDGIEVVFDWAKSKVDKLESYPSGSEALADLTSNLTTSDVPVTSPNTPTGLTLSPDAVAEKHVDPPTTVTGLITWAFLYADVCHQVLPVSSGTRLTVAYDIWRRSESASLNSSQNNVTSSDNTALDHFISLLCDDKAFMPHGGRLAFGTRHAYPVDRCDKSMSHLVGFFKGCDAGLVDVLNKLGLLWEIRAVYDHDPYDDDDYSGSERSNSTKVPNAQFDPTVISFGSVGARHTLYTGSDFWALEGGYYGSCCGGDMSTSETYSIDEDVIWVTEPGAYGHSNDYFAFGNAPVAATIYVGVAVFVCIPPAGERERFQAML